MKHAMVYQKVLFLAKKHTSTFYTVNTKNSLKKLQKKNLFTESGSGTTREEMREKQLVEDLVILEDPTERKSISDIHHIFDS